jgi:quercetin dioxygenase-like cupin family protein
MRKAMLVVLVAAAIAAPLVVVAQDPTKVDAKHYKVEFENDQVRVLRITYGPGEKSVMHEHPGAVAVFVTGGKVKFTNADGTTQEQDTKAGTSQWTPAGKHLPENIGTKPFEVLLVEVKTPAPKG